MSGYKTFAVWGAGNQGTALVKELLVQPSVSSVTVLTRAVCVSATEILMHGDEL
jgi:hypothetical protein